MIVTGGYGHWWGVNASLVASRPYAVFDPCADSVALLACLAET
jgi:hypothetical protein